MKKSVMLTLFNKKAVLPLMPVVLFVSACGGGGSNTSVSTAPLLQVGMQRQFSGAVTRTTVYTSPTSTTPNNTLAYTYAQTQNVLQAVANAQANFDLRSVYSYAITQDPGTGSVPISQTVDDFRNLITSGSSQATVDVAQTAVTFNNDESSNTLGGGPFKQTTTTNTTYPTQRTSLYYPLQAGVSITVPQSAAQNISFADLNATGAPPSDGSNIGYTRVRAQNNDGSFSFQQTGATGITQALAQNADGSGSNTVASPTSTTATTLGLPVQAFGVYSIPVTRVITSAAPSTKSFSSTDWYPNGGQPSSPLILETQTVIGPVTALPAQCNGALLQPNMFEIDTNTSNLSTINASLTVTTTRGFNSNGVAVCALTQQTTTSYNLTTGALVSTTTMQTNAILTAIK